MKKIATELNDRQMIAQELFVGTLIYATVLGLFNDYTDIVVAQSFSTVLSASIVLEILTFLTFLLKKRTVSLLSKKQTGAYTVLMWFCVWLIMFVSKFVFVGAIDLIFGDYITIYGFFGILYVVLSVTIIHRLAYYVFQKLGMS